MEQIKNFQRRIVSRAARRCARLMVLIVLCAMPLIIRFPVGAQNGTNIEEFIFGSVGITPTQTARLNVVNTTTDKTVTRVLKFLDDSGNALVTKTVTLSPGQSDFLDLNGATIGSGRVQIRALDPTCPGCNIPLKFGIIQTLELIDNVTSKTELLYSPAQFRPDVPPSVPFGMVGVVSDQTVRINVSAEPSSTNPTDPIRIVLSFANRNGQLITNADGHPLEPELTLMPGESLFYDLPATLILAGQPRAQFRPMIKPDPRPIRIIATLELIDDATDKTEILYAPVARSCGAN